MRVLCDAVSFGYGPIGKLLAVSPFLPATWTITLLASNTSYALATKSNFKNVVFCDTESFADLQEKHSLFIQSDLFINIMNPVSAKFASQIGIPMVEIR